MPIQIRFAQDVLMQDVVYRLRATVREARLRETQPLEVSRKEGTRELSILQDYSPENEAQVHRASVTLTREGSGSSASPPGVHRVPPVARIFDRFDVYPNSRLLTALDGLDAVGTLRIMVLDPAVGSPVPLPPELPPEMRFALVDQWAIDASYAHTSVSRVLLKVATRWAFEQGCDLILCVVPPSECELLHIIGCQPTGLSNIYVLSRSKMTSSFLEDRLGQRMGLSGMACDRIILRRGEPLFKRGGVGDAAYMVARGSLRLESRDLDGRVIPAGSVGPGEVVGEEVVLESPPRRFVDAYADAEAVDVWVVGRDALRERMAQDAVSRNFFQAALGRRLQALACFSTARSIESIAQGVLEILLDLSCRFCPQETSAASGRSGNVLPQLMKVTCTAAWLGEHIGCGTVDTQAVLSRLESLGLISLRNGRIAHIDAAGLANLQASVLSALVAANDVGKDLSVPGTALQAAS